MLSCQNIRFFWRIFRTPADYHNMQESKLRLGFAALQQLQKICAKAQVCSAIIECPYRVKQGVREFCSAASYNVGIHVSHWVTLSSPKQKYHHTHSAAEAVGELPEELQQSNSGMEKMTSHLPPSRQRIACSEQRQNQSPVYFVSRYNGAFFSWQYVMMLVVHGTDHTLLLDWSQMPDSPSPTKAPVPQLPVAPLLTFFSALWSNPYGNKWKNLLGSGLSIECVVNRKLLSTKAINI